MAVAITRREYGAPDLRQLAVKSRDAAQSRRLLAIAMVLEGSSREDAARQAGMDRQTLRDWVHRYNEIGVGGLVSRCAPGPASKLTAAQMEELRALVLAGPDPAVHHVVRWRCVDLRDEVARRFGVAVQERAVGKWLRKLGLTSHGRRRYRPTEAQRSISLDFKQSSGLLPAHAGLAWSAKPNAFIVHRTRTPNGCFAAIQHTDEAQAGRCRLRPVADNVMRWSFTPAYWRL